jgi:hypothetical protein
MNSATLYRWPDAARFGRVVPKTKFYEHATVPRAVRERFVADVQRITWAYKLADATVHLRGEAAVPEIQVFIMDAKAEDVSDDVLAVIDKAVQFPIIFEVNRRTGEHLSTRMVAAHKQLGGTSQRRSAYFSTEWLAANAPRAPLPPAVDLSGLYAGLLRPILPMPPRPGECLADATQRVDQARKLEREIAALEQRLRNEPQFNRKVELRRELRDRSAALDTLKAR